MSGLVRWIEPEMIQLRGRWRPGFAADPRYSATQWEGSFNYSPSEHQWRSYVHGGEEVARMLLHLLYPSHSQGLSDRALMIWNFEVRADLRGGGIGTTIIHQLLDEHSDREIYVGPTSDSVAFWERFGWPKCGCDDCDGRDFLVCRP